MNTTITARRAHATTMGLATSVLLVIFAAALTFGTASASASPTAGAVMGTKHDDHLVGDNSRNNISGRAGDDVIDGNGGNDKLHGNRGDDTLNGGKGRDRLWGGRGADSLNGGKGNDHLFALADDGRTDTLNCGPGKDTAVVRAEDVTVGCENVRII